MPSAAARASVIAERVAVVEARAGRLMRDAVAGQRGGERPAAPPRCAGSPRSACRCTRGRRRCRRSRARGTPPGCRRAAGGARRARRRRARARGHHLAEDDRLGELLGADDDGAAAAGAVQAATPASEHQRRGASAVPRHPRRLGACASAFRSRRNAVTKSSAGAAASVANGPCCTMRPARISTTTSARCAASPTSCVTRMTVLPSDRKMPRRSSRSSAAPADPARDERLVEQQHLGIEQQRAHHRDALRLPARQLVRVAGERVGREARQRRQLLQPRARCAPRPSAGSAPSA